jgi:hypothetical protein
MVAAVTTSSEGLNSYLDIFSKGGYSPESVFSAAS